MSGVVRELNVDNCCSPKASSYDHFSAGLVASIVICGFVVLSLMMVWLFGTGQQSRGFVPDFDPHPDVVIDDSSGLEQELDDVVGGSGGTELVSLLESVEKSVSKQRADSGSPDNGYLRGAPDDRKPGPVSANSHSSRWKVSFEVEDIEQYKRQLDFFGIEIGVIEGRKDDIWRIRKLASAALVTQSSRDKEQLSTWFAHSKPTLKRWDQQIARESGVATEDRLFVQFYPVELVAKIMLLEAEALQKQERELDEVDITNIRIIQSGNQFSVSISEFEFR